MLALVYAYVRRYYRMYIQIYVCVHVCMHICMYMRMYACMHVGTYVCISVSTHVHMYVYTFILCLHKAALLCGVQRNLLQRYPRQPSPLAPGGRAVVLGSCELPITPSGTGSFHAYNENFPWLGFVPDDGNRT